MEDNNPSPACPSENWTTTVPKAGAKYLGLGKNASYAAAKRGDIPTLKIGKLLRVPVAAMKQKLEEV